MPRLVLFYFVLRVLNTDSRLKGAFVGFSDDDPRQWQVSLGIQIIPGGILALLILLFPESPRWLIQKGREAEGLRTLAKLHANGDEGDAWVQAEYQQITETISIEREQSAHSYLELFRDKSSFRRLLLACAIQASIQMTGVSAIQYYSVSIYAKIGIEGADTLRYQAISSVLALVAQFLCILFIDRLGRRWPLIIGNLGNMVTFIIATVLLALYPPGTGHSGGPAWAFIAMTWLYNFCFSATCGPLSWIIPAEIFDTKTRSKGVSIACMISFSFNTMIGQTTSVALDDETGIGWRWYILFIVRLHPSLKFTLDSTNQSPPRFATSRMPSSSTSSSPRLPKGLSRRCATSLPRLPGWYLGWTTPNSRTPPISSVVLWRLGRSKPKRVTLSMLLCLMELHGYPCLRRDVFSLKREGSDVTCL